MEVGDLVVIYYGDSGINSDFWVDTTGLITARFGYKTEVLVESEIQNWTISDLEHMKRDREEDINQQRMENDNESN